MVRVPLLVLSLRPPRIGAADRHWSPTTAGIVFFGVGCYGGAFQAGIGLLLVLALSRSGLDLVLANGIKVVVILVVTVTALPVFVARDLVDWAPALVLAAGVAAGAPTPGVNKWYTWRRPQNPM